MQPLELLTIATPDGNDENGFSKPDRDFANPLSSSWSKKMAVAVVSFLVITGGIIGISLSATSHRQSQHPQGNKAVDNNDEQASDTTPHDQCLGDNCDTDTSNNSNKKESAVTCQARACINTKNCHEMGCWTIEDAMACSSKGCMNFNCEMVGCYDYNNKKRLEEDPSDATGNDSCDDEACINPNCNQVGCYSNEDAIACAMEGCLNYDCATVGCRDIPWSLYLCDEERGCINADCKESGDCFTIDDAMGCASKGCMNYDCQDAGCFGFEDKLVSLPVDETLNSCDDQGCINPNCNQVGCFNDSQAVYCAAQGCLNYDCDEVGCRKYVH